MYETHFGLRQRPFPALADSAFYYPATSHEQALAELEQAFREDEAFALLMGEPGTGKTLLCHCLLDRLGEAVTTAFLPHGPFADRHSFLQALAYDLSLSYEGRSEQELRLTLTEHLLKEYEAGRRTVCVVDEAQHLTPALLEELRLLSNLEGRGGRALQMILAGQLTLETHLTGPEAAALSQRVGAWARLAPLGVHEAADYVVHHLRAAGGKPERIISDEALELAARGTRGIPRLLNRVLHQALVLTFHAEAEQIDAEVMLEVLQRLTPIGLGLPMEESGDALPEETSRAEGAAKGVSDGVLALEEKVSPLRPVATPRRPA